MSAKVTWGHGVLNAMRGPEPVGGIFWFGDEYPFNADYSDSIEQLVVNVMATLTSPGPKRVACGSGMTFIKTALNSLGHTAGTPANWNNLTVANYDFAIVPQWTNQTLIWNFVQAGGGVMVPLGTYDETLMWGTLFTYTGIVHNASYVFGGLVTPNGGAPYFTGVTSVYMNGSSQLSTTVPSAGGTVEAFTGTRSGSTYTVFAVWQPS